MHRDSEVGHKADIDNISIILYIWPGQGRNEGRRGEREEGRRRGRGVLGEGEV